LESTLPVALASLAQAINTFLAGLLMIYLPYDRQWLSLILTMATLIMVGLGVTVKPGKYAFVLSSFLFFMGGCWMLFSSIYLGFFMI
jgi:hypothetical protein